MKIQTICISFLILSLFFSCNPESESNNDYSSLKDAAQETSMNFNSSDIEKTVSEFIEVPAIYWAEDIKNEHPIRVYSHNNNIAFVQNENTTSEEGIYIYVPFSSYIPQNTENVQFTVIEQDIYKFVKNK